MRIRYITRSAGPEGCFEPGQTRELPDDQAKALLIAGAAVPLDAPYRVAAIEPREERAVAVSPAPAQPQGAAKRRKRRGQ